jgi:hypothetical protein
MEYHGVRGFLIFLGLLLVVGGGGVAALQYAPVDLSVLDSISGAKDFLRSPMALYAGGGAAGLGLVLIIIAAATGGRKTKTARRTPARAEPDKAEIVAPEPAPSAPGPRPAQQPVAAAQGLEQASTPVATPAASKPTASAQPPASATGDSRLLNRKRVSDLVTINDALKAFHAKHGAYPKAGGLDGFPERGAAWIPELEPDFLKALPRDPAMSNDKAGPQYVYASDGSGYKLLAQGVSLIGGTNVEVLGVRIDPTRQPTAENAAFGFWTENFASA